MGGGRRTKKFPEGPSAGKTGVDCVECLLLTSFLSSAVSRVLDTRVVTPMLQRGHRSFPGELVTAGELWTWPARARAPRSPLLGWLPSLGASRGCVPDTFLSCWFHSSVAAWPEALGTAAGEASPPSAGELGSPDQ